MRVGIITGGHLDREFVENELEKQGFDCLIAVDKGTEFFLTSKFKPDYIVGDFDSVKKGTVEKLQQKYDTPVQQHPAVKDETDTELALMMAMDLKADHIIIYGATGTRIDHVLGNIQLLKMAAQHKVKCYLVDLYNRISMITGDTVLYKKQQYGDYISLIPFTEEVQDLTLKGFKYNLDRFLMKNGNARGVSNEIEEEKATISFTAGTLILVESKDN